jgi:hemoglobin
MERESTVLEAAGGPEAVLRLARAWHERVMADKVVSHAFSHGFRADHTERLAAYLTEAWGGPSEFTDRLGSHWGVVRLHSGQGEHLEMDQRAEACFAQALVDADIPVGVRPVLRDYWHWATTLMSSHPGEGDPTLAPDEPLPHWGWGGLQPTNAR